MFEHDKTDGDRRLKNDELRSPCNVRAIEREAELYPLFTIVIEKCTSRAFETSSLTVE